MGHSPSQASHPLPRPLSHWERGNTTNSDAKACRCECADPWPRPESLPEMPKMECRWPGENSLKPGLQVRRDSAKCPWHYDDPAAIGYESLPGQTPRSAKAA